MARGSRAECKACKRGECWDCIKHVTRTDWCTHLCAEVPNQLQLFGEDHLNGSVQARGERDLPGR